MHGSGSADIRDTKTDVVVSFNFNLTYAINDCTAGGRTSNHVLCPIVTGEVTLRGNLCILGEFLNRLLGYMLSR